MAKKVELRERGTQNIMYPVTLPECVIGIDGKTITENITEGDKNLEQLIDTINSRLSWKIIREEQNPKE